MTSDPRLLAREFDMELTTGSEGCFHQRSSGLRLCWSPSSASLTVGQRELRTTLAQVKAIAERVVQAAERPEVSSGGGSTTGYRATLRWRFRASIEEPWSTGEATFASREIPSRDVEEFIKARPELAKRIPPGVYARAVGLYELVESIERELTGSPT